MKDTQNVTIILLVITAVILGAMVVSAFRAAPAYAESAGKARNYIVAPGAWNNERDVFYVIDLASRRLNLYGVNTQTKTIELADSKDLDQELAQ